MTGARSIDRAIATTMAVLAVATLAPRTPTAAEIDHAAEYPRCMAQAAMDPEDGFAAALAWRDLGGGDAAEHCAATSLINLGLFSDGAARLEKLAQTIKRELEMKAKLLGQAAQAWLLAEEPERAAAASTSALELFPGSAVHLIDRAQARASRGDYKGSLADLDAAIANDTGRPDAYVFRATAKRFLKDEVGALEDVEKALALNIAHADALLERGILRRLAGDDDGAREDWLIVLSVAPGSESARAARANIERMDVTGE